MIGRYVIVRTYSAGVHMGILADQKDKNVRLLNARRLWYWRGAFTLNEVATSGVIEGSKLSVAVPEIVLTEAIEILPVSDKAESNLKEFKAYATGV